MNCANFQLATQILSSTFLISISSLFLYFAISEHGPSANTFVPYWMVIVAIILKLEILFSWISYTKKEAKLVLNFDVLLKIAVLIITIVGVFMQFTYIMSVGGFDKAPRLFIYGFGFGLYIVKVYACIFIKYLVTVCYDYLTSFQNKTRKMKTLLEYVVIYVTNVILLGIGVLFLYVGIRDNCWSGRLDVCFYLPTWMILVAVLIFIDRLIYWKHKFNGVVFEGKFPRPRSSIRNSNKEQIRQWQKDKQKRSSSKKLRTSSIVFRVILSLVTLGLTITALHVLIAVVHGKGAENPDPIIFSFYFGLLTLFVYFCMLIKYLYNFCMSRVKKSKSTTPAPMPNP
ncbi:hypothetical protein B9Z55_020875 [Caenorhabditis nigoni]|nr:hypothetical protein B9Z55_020875 [Caenorhabditis nigoni]